VVPGETALAFYTAENCSDQEITGIATYNVTPNAAAAYFNKIQCFCFEYQLLKPHEKVAFPFILGFCLQFSEGGHLLKSPPMPRLTCPFSFSLILTLPRILYSAMWIRLSSLTPFLEPKVAPPFFKTYQSPNDKETVSIFHHKQLSLAPSFFSFHAPWFLYLLSFPGELRIISFSRPEGC